MSPLSNPLPDLELRWTPEEGQTIEGKEQLFDIASFSIYDKYSTISC